MDQKRVYGLDILRALAILWVVYGHAHDYLKAYVPEKEYMLFNLDGVTIFFVLSGYLIGTILLKTIEKRDGLTVGTLSNFWLRRWLRTLPAYLFVLLLLISYNYFKSRDNSISGYAEYFFFFQTARSGIDHLYPESWSLCVEEWFYLTIPLLLFFSFRMTWFRKKTIILFWIFAILVLVGGLKIAKQYFGDFQEYNGWDLFLRKALVTRLDSIMWGFFGAYLSFYKNPVWTRYKKLFLVTGIAIMLLFNIINYLSGFNQFKAYSELILMPFAALLVLPFLSSIRNGKGLMFRFFSFISVISYSMYLLNLTPYQEFILPGLDRFLPSPGVWYGDMIRLAGFLTFAIGGSWLLYSFIEKPFMRLRDRLPRISKEERPFLEVPAADISIKVL
jgi:peptidoglycan/LPS O-acetylase OafA/YrhL